MVLNNAKATWVRGGMQDKVKIQIIKETYVYRINYTESKNGAWTEWIVKRQYIYTYFSTSSILSSAGMKSSIDYSKNNPKKAEKREEFRQF